MLQISTKIRYGTRALIQLALNFGSRLLTLKEIADREKISEKYLGGILVALKSAGIVDSIKGKYGGYKLAKDPGAVSLLDIVSVFEKDILVNTHLENPDSDFYTWEKIETSLEERLEAVTLKETVNTYLKHNSALEYQI